MLQAITFHLVDLTIIDFYQTELWGPIAVSLLGYEYRADAQKSVLK